MITSSSMVIASSFADIVAERRDSLDPAAIRNSKKKIQLAFHLTFNVSFITSNPPVLLILFLILSILGPIDPIFESLL